MFPAAQHLGLGIADSNLGMLGAMNAYNRSGGGGELMNSDHGSAMDRLRQQQERKLDSNAKTCVNVVKGEPKKINFLGSSTFEDDADSYHLQTNYIDEPKEIYFKDDDICTSLPFEFCCVPDVHKQTRPS
ncbi:hypothetical protein KSP40_PGU015506 [Platanthera guangdongensis]|uniref:Uncharacterized protein n=1 Tax=Platanthera guangdongensis TaxID=2320717 RepID=A0ABR2MLU6_9ASPA